MCEEECESESNPKPRPQPKPSSVYVAERGVASICGCALIGKPLCGGGVCVGGGGRAFYDTYICNGKRYSCEGAELVGVLVAETIHPACVCEGGGRGGERGGRAFYYTYIYNGEREEEGITH